VSLLLSALQHESVFAESVFLLSRFFLLTRRVFDESVFAESVFLHTVAEYTGQGTDPLPVRSHTNDYGEPPIAGTPTGRPVRLPSTSR